MLNLFRNENRFYYIFLTLILLCISVLVCWNANWILGDDVQFITRTAVGKPVYAYTAAGRFWPLGLCDYSILLFIPCGNTPLAHFVYTAIIMSAAVLLFFNSLMEITQSAPISLFTTITMIFCSAFFQLHLQCIYPERMIFFILAVFMFCFLRRERSFGFQFGAWLSATYAIFCKEPMFGLFLVFSFAGLLFYRKKPCDIALYCSIIFSSISYMVAYTYLIFSTKTVPIYGNPFGSGTDLFSILNVFVQQIEREPILFLLLLMSFVRVYQVVKSREVEFTDILALSGWSYVFAYTLLGSRFYAAYYCFPALVFIYPMFALILKESDLRSLKNSLIGVVCCMICVFGYGAKYFQTNLEKSKKILYLREHDMSLVNMLAEKFFDGRKIMIISRVNGLFGKAKAIMIAEERYVLNVLNSFLAFVTGRKIDQENGVQLQEDILDEKCIVISSVTDYPDYFSLKGKFHGYNIYEREQSK